MWRCNHKICNRARPHSSGATKLSLWLGAAAALAFAFFIKLTSELLEYEVSGLDVTILIGFAKARFWLTVMAVDLTALGSITLVVLISIISLCVLLLLKDRMAALQLVIASAGAGILTSAANSSTEPALRKSLSLSRFRVYPTQWSFARGGYSLYLTVAILVCRHLQRTLHKIAIVTMTMAIILLVGLSRIYLGVHYPSDAAGDCAGPSKVTMITTKTPSNALGPGLETAHI